MWADEPKEDPALTEVFPGEQGGVWTYDERTGQHYLHRFFAHQPDLNVANPAVREELARIAGFWLELGVSGFRMDAVPFLLELNGIEEAPTVDPQQYLREFRAFVNRRRGDAVLLGEVNLPPEEQRRYLGDEDGDGLHLVFNFSVMQKIWLAMAREDATPVAEALRALPPVPFDSQWASFLRNHDELTLDQLTADEREECFAAFGPEEDMQVYGRGLRRRLPTMLGNDRDRIEMAYSLQMSLPGTPVLFYGEELGLGENLDEHGRSAVRTPMQWTDGPTGGFSSAAARRPAGPAADRRARARRAQRRSGPAGPDVAAVVDEALIRARNQTLEWGFGSWQVLDTDVPAVLAHRCDWDGRAVIALHNFSAAPCKVRLPLDEGPATVLDDLLDPARDPIAGPAPVIELGRYGYRWLRVSPATSSG